MRFGCGQKGQKWVIFCNNILGDCQGSCPMTSLHRCSAWQRPWALCHSCPDPVSCQISSFDEISAILGHFRALTTPQDPFSSTRDPMLSYWTIPALVFIEFLKIWLFRFCFSLFGTHSWLGKGFPTPFCSSLRALPSVSTLHRYYITCSNILNKFYYVFQLFYLSTAVAVSRQYLLTYVCECHMQITWCARRMCGLVS